MAARLLACLHGVVVGATRARAYIRSEAAPHEHESRMKLTGDPVEDYSATSQGVKLALLRARLV
jgi:hypothetical protein